MLDQIARHGLIDLDIKAEGDLHIDAHHTVEDVGITLGQAFATAVGDKKGIRRYGHAYVPLDEALSRVVIDFSGRPGLEFNVPFTRARIGDFDVDLTREFFQGLVNHALVTCTSTTCAAGNAHHQCETVFKAFGRALRMARGARSAPARASFLPPRACSNSAIHEYAGTDICRDFHRHRRLRHGQPALRRAAPWRSPRPTRDIRISQLRPRTSARPTASCFPGQGAMPDCMRDAERIGPARSGAARRAASKPLAGRLRGRCRCCFDRSEKARPPCLGLFPAWCAVCGPQFARPSPPCEGRPHHGGHRRTPRRCRTWAGTACARRARTRIWAGIPDGTGSISCTAYYAEPADPSLTVGKADYGGRLYLRHGGALTFSPCSSTRRRAPSTACACTAILSIHWIPAARCEHDTRAG